MAGRPATVRGSGLTGMHYFAFSMAGVSLVMLVVTIIVVTQLKDAQTRARSLEERARVAGTAPGYYANEAQARGSAEFTVMQDDIDRLARLAVGSAGVAPAVEAEAHRLLAQVAEQHGGVTAADALTTAVSKLSDQLAAQKNQGNTLQEQLTAANQKNDELTERLKQTKSEFDAEVARMAERVEQVNKQKEQALAAKEEQFTSLQASSESMTQELNTQRQESQRREREDRLTIAQLQNQTQALQKELAGIKPISFDPGAILTKADGRIIRAVPGSNVVYINIGEQDGLKVGMGFEVYSQTREAAKSYRGKASIEVVSVSEQTAECRVLRITGGAPIIENDPIVNIAFERGRKPKFVVVGDYDLNFDGNVDFDGPEKVKGMIRRWGGVAVDEFDETVDFVIIGAAPAVPIFTDESAVSAVVRAQAAEKLEALQRYRDLITRAQAIYVPVITQNQFLFLVGFAGETEIAQR